MGKRRQEGIQNRDLSIELPEIPRDEMLRRIDVVNGVGRVDDSWRGEQIRGPKQKGEAKKQNAVAHRARSPQFVKPRRTVMCIISHDG